MEVIQIFFLMKIELAEAKENQCRDQKGVLQMETAEVAIAGDISSPKLTSQVGSPKISFVCTVAPGWIIQSVLLSINQCV